MEVTIARFYNFIWLHFAPFQFYGIVNIKYSQTICDLYVHALQLCILQLDFFVPILTDSEIILRNYSYYTIAYQNNTYRKDLGWPHFDDEPRVQEKQQVKDQQSYVSVFVACLTNPSSNWDHQPRRDNSIPYMDVW